MDSAQKTSSYKAPKYLEVVEITQDKGVLKKIIRQGQVDGGGGGQEDLVPLPGQEIVISYTCHLENGVLVDSSAEHEKT